MLNSNKEIPEDYKNLKTSSFDYNTKISSLENLTNKHQSKNNSFKLPKIFSKIFLGTYLLSQSVFGQVSADITGQITNYKNEGLESKIILYQDLGEDQIIKLDSTLTDTNGYYNIHKDNITDIDDLEQITNQTFLTYFKGQLNSPVPVSVISRVFNSIGELVETNKYEGTNIFINKPSTYLAAGVYFEHKTITSKTQQKILVSKLIQIGGELNYYDGLKKIPISNKIKKTLPKKHQTQNTQDYVKLILKSTPLKETQTTIPTTKTIDCYNAQNGINKIINIKHQQYAKIILQELIGQPLTQKNENINDKLKFQIKYEINTENLPIIINQQNKPTIQINLTQYDSAKLTWTDINKEFLKLATIHGQHTSPISTTQKLMGSDPYGQSKQIIEPGNIRVLREMELDLEQLSRAINAKDTLSLYLTIDKQTGFSQTAIPSGEMNISDLIKMGCYKLSTDGPDGAEYKGSVKMKYSIDANKDTVNSIQQVIFRYDSNGNLTNQETLDMYKKIFEEEQKVAENTGLINFEKNILYFDSINDPNFKAYYESRKNPDNPRFGKNIMTMSKDQNVNFRTMEGSILVYADAYTSGLDSVKGFSEGFGFMFDDTPGVGNVASLVLADTKGPDYAIPYREGTNTTMFTHTGIRLLQSIKTGTAMFYIGSKD